MAKFETTHEDLNDIFDGIIANKNLERNVNIEILSDIKQKQIYKVVKSNELMKHVSAKKTDVFIIINDVIFDGLEEWQQIVVAEEAVTTIVFNAEKDKLEIKKGDVGITSVGAFSGILQKFGVERYEAIQESIKTLYSVEQDEEQPV